MYREKLLKSINTKKRYKYMILESVEWFQNVHSTYDLVIRLLVHFLINSIYLSIITKQPDITMFQITTIN